MVSPAVAMQSDMKIFQQGECDDFAEPAKTETTSRVKDDSVDAPKPTQNKKGKIIIDNGGDDVASPPSFSSTNAPVRHDIANATAKNEVKCGMKYRLVALGVVLLIATIGATLSVVLSMRDGGDKSDPVPEPTPPPIPQNQPYEEGQSPQKIVDGTEAVEDRFSYAVSLQYLNQHNCGGSLIARDVVLTAANCGYHTSVVLGRHDLYDSDGEVLSIRGEYPHPDFDYYTLDNDFMLVFLEGSPTAEDVVTVKLNPDPSVPSVIGEIAGQDMTVMGWGDTDPIMYDDFAVSSDVLLNIDVGYLSSSVCASIWDGGITDGMLCAKRSFGQGACNGDSGGPLIIKGGNGAGEDIQVGVVSFTTSLGCATYIPDVYARVSHAYEWIRTEVCNGSTYASEAGFDCNSIVFSPSNPPAFSTSPPVSSPTNPPAFSLTNAPTSSPPDADDDGGNFFDDMLDIILGLFDGNRV
jgi:hypothetical protein